MPLKPDLADLTDALDSLEDVKDHLLDKVAPTEEEMRCEREMERALAILRAHIHTLQAVGYG